MNPIIVTTIPFFNLATASPFTGEPYFFTNNDTMVFVWPIALSNSNRRLKGIYFTLLKDDGSYCSFYTYDVHDESFNSVLENISMVKIVKNTILCSNEYSFLVCPIPPFGINGTKTRIYAPIHYPLGECSDYNGIQSGPFFDNDFTIAFIGQSTQGIEFGYGMVYDIRNGEQMGYHIFDGNPTSMLYSFGVNLDQTTQCIHNAIAYGGDITNTNIYVVSQSIVYDASLLCYVPIPPAPAGSNNGIFNIINLKTLFLTVPDPGIISQYSTMDSDNPFITIFSAHNGVSTNFYLFCAALNIGILFQTSEHINAYTSALFKQKAYFCVSNFIHVTSSVLPLENIPQVSNSDGPPISGFGGSGSNSDVFNNTTKNYLINFNRPISAIGAYKS